MGISAVIYLKQGVQHHLLLHSVVSRFVRFGFHDIIYPFSALTMSLDRRKCELPHKKTNNFAYAKTKAQISCAVNKCTADQCLCFRYTDSTIPLLSKSKISSL